MTREPRCVNARTISACGVPRRRARLILSCLLLPLAAAPVRAQHLFRDTSALAITIRADLPSLFNDRDTTRRREYPGALTVTNDQGRSIELPVMLSTRPHFKRREETCTVPPIRVRFHRQYTRGTPFEGHLVLRLVTHCRPRREYESHVLEEYLVYRMFNVVTDTSYRVRLARVGWTSRRDPDHRDERWGFFIEQDNALATRVRGSLAPATKSTLRTIDTANVATVGLFEYMIGNGEWDLAKLRNVRLLAFRRAKTAAVPFNFDYSGVVGARYAVPAAAGIEVESRREYRGPCITLAAAKPIVERLRTAREGFRAEYLAVPVLEHRRQRALSYVDEFFEIADDSARFDAALQYDAVYRFRLGVARRVAGADLVAAGFTGFLTLGTTF